MGLISPTQISDSTTIDASDVNNPINTIANEFNGNIDNSNIKSAAGIATTKLAADNGIGAGSLSASAITLGYTSIVANVVLTTPTVATQVTGLTSTVTIPAGSRKIKITAYSSTITNDNNNAAITLSIWDGAVNSGTQLSSWVHSSGTVAGDGFGVTCIAIVIPAAGSKTYNVGLKASAGSPTLVAAATSPAFILVEAI